MSTTTENKQLMTTTTQNEEGTQMTTNTATTARKPIVTANNKKFQKYDALREESKALEVQIAANRKAQSDLVMDKIRSFQTIGQSVYTKCTSGSYADLGSLSWINHSLQLKELSASTITLTATSRYGHSNPHEVRLNRQLLHISDRDFAKLVRAQIRSYKDEQRVEKVESPNIALKNAQSNLQSAKAAAELAEKKLKEVEAKAAEEAATREARAERKARGEERRREALAAKS